MQTAADSLPSRASASPASSATSGEMERMTRDFRQFISDCETLLKNAQTLSTEGAALARAEITRRMADARVKLVQLKEAAGERAVSARGATEEYVRREPMKSVLIAAAVGAVIALLVARR